MLPSTIWVSWMYAEASIYLQCTASCEPTHSQRYMLPRENIDSQRKRIVICICKRFILYTQCFYIGTATQQQKQQIQKQIIDHETNLRWIASLFSNQKGKRLQVVLVWIFFFVLAILMSYNCSGWRKTGQLSVSINLILSRTQGPLCVHDLSNGCSFSHIRPKMSLYFLRRSTEICTSTQST